jgi:hypothetical protein
MKPHPCVALLRAALIGLTLLVPVFAQSPATGTIEGRVLSAETGDSIENARVTVEGTALETLTDVTGRFAPGSRRRHSPSPSSRVARRNRTSTCPTSPRCAVPRPAARR